MMKRLIPAVALMWGLTGTASATESYGLPDKIQDGNILHCFDWTMADVKAELPNIAAAGFGAVQLSPLQRGDIRTGSPWHDLYRPYDLAFKPSGMGSAADLMALCEEAGKYGIKVIVDVVANHVDKTAGYHDPWWDSNGRVRWEGGINYGDRRSITHGQLGDYGDINSESAEVTARAKAYVQDLADMGVKGIRWDAAKHIGLPSEGCNFWKEVTSVPGVWHYGEILNEAGPDNRIIKEYASFMSVTDNRYSNSAARDNGGLPQGHAGDWVSNQGLPDSKVVYWGESHDTYSNDEWSQNVDQSVIDRAWAANACRNGATALYFSRPNAKGFNNIKVGKGSTSFKNPQIAEVNKFRNAMVGKAEYFSNGGNAVSITREGGGAVIVMKGSGNVSVANGGGYCPAGTYTDHVSGGTFTVTGSTITGTVGPSGIAVIYGQVTRDASLSFSPAGGEFVGTISVKVTPMNCSSAWYKIGDGQQVSVSSATTFTLGSDMADGQSVTVSWSATGESGVKTGSLTFKKVAKPAIDPKAVYFDNSNSRWSQPYVHYWGGASASTWPGEKMSSLTGDIWMYVVPDGTTGLVFNDGNGAQTGDLNCVQGHLYDAQAGDRGAYNGTNPDPDPDPDPVVDMPASLYVLGDLKGASWDTTAGVEMSKSGNTFVAKGVELEAAPGESTCYFNLTDRLGSSWDDLNTNANRYGSPSEGVEVGIGKSAEMVKYAASVNASACKSWTIPAGKYNLVADFSNNTVYAVDTVSGIEIDLGDDEAPVEYFDMQGRRVENPSKGIFIVRQGSRVGKALVR